MNRLAVVAVALVITLGLTAAGFALQRQAPSSRPVAPEEKADAVEHTMTQYWFGLIYRGPKATKEVTPEVMELQKAHLANIGRLAEERKLVLAGPFGHDGDLRGIFIFDVKTREEAEKLVASDPAVKAGRLRVELLPWWGTTKLRQVVAPEG